MDQTFSCTDNVWILRLFFGLCQFVYGSSNNNYLNPQRQTDTDQKTSSESIHSPTQYNNIISWTLLMMLIQFWEGWAKLKQTLT